MVGSNFILVLKKQHVSNGGKMEIFFEELWMHKEPAESPACLTSSCNAPEGSCKQFGALMKVALE